LPVLAGLLAVLLMGFAGTSYGVVRWDVLPAPTEVVNTGRSEVTGSINLLVEGAGTTGTAAGGNVQIGIIYTNPAMQIDNTTTTGIKLITSLPLASATIVSVENRDINGRCSGFITINIPANIAVVAGDFIRLEGVRGRIDASLAVTPGTDLFASLQSINDPAANLFEPDVVRVAKSLDGMNVLITPSSLLLCFPTTGVPPSGTAVAANSITITEGFARAFVDNDANNDGVNANDRVDSQLAALGDPTNSTQFQIALDSIPASVSGLTFPGSVPVSSPATGATLRLVSSTFDATGGVALAVYAYEALNQTNNSDLSIETFIIQPAVTLKVGATQTGVINAAVSLGPAVAAATGCGAPGSGLVTSRPRFLDMDESDAVSTNNPPDDPSKPFATIIRCNCYLLFTHVTNVGGFNTGLAIANTTGDTAVFGLNEAPDQLGKITFYFFDRTAGFVGQTQTTADLNAGQSFVGLLSQVLPTGVTSFSGYVFAKADFQFCHGFAFIADQNFANIAQGYVASVVPDPAIKGLGGRRAAVAAGDPTNIPAGESLNN
jgi:hypothetical protein